MSSSPESDLSALHRAIETFAEAWASGDGDTLSSLLCEEYIHVDLFGRILNHDEWLGYAGGRTGRGTRQTFRSVETRQLGEVAIVTGLNDMTGGGAISAGDSSDLSIAFTQVWVWRDAGWKRLSFQATPVQSAEAS